MKTRLALLGVPILVGGCAPVVHSSPFGSHPPRPAGHEIQLYESWNGIQEVAARHVRDADVAMVTSYCADAALTPSLLGMVLYSVVPSAAVAPSKSISR